MIQFNLLPDVKVQYIKAARTKKLVILISTLTASASLSLMIIMLIFVKVLQAKSITSLDKSIKTNSDKLQNTPELDKILTVQNQLLQLPALHDKKPISSRLANYLDKLTPDMAKLSDIQVDFTLNTIKLVGTADTLATANKFADTIKFATVTDINNKTKKAFTDHTVVESAFARDEKGANFTITATFDASLFAANEIVSMDVPKQYTTTRSYLEKPTNVLFDGTILEPSKKAGQ